MAVYELSKLTAKTICDQVNESGGNLLDLATHNSIKAFTVRSIDPTGGTKGLDELGMTESDDVLLRLDPCKECDGEILSCLSVLAAAIDFAPVITSDPRTFTITHTGTVTDTGTGTSIVPDVSSDIVTINDTTDRDSDAGEIAANNFTMRFKTDFTTGVIVPENVTGGYTKKFADTGAGTGTFTITLLHQVNLKTIISGKECC